MEHLGRSRHHLPNRTDHRRHSTSTGHLEPVEHLSTRGIHRRELRGCRVSIADRRWHVGISFWNYGIKRGLKSYFEAQNEYFSPKTPKHLKKNPSWPNFSIWWPRNPIFPKTSPWTRFWRLSFISDWKSAKKCKIWPWPNFSHGGLENRIFGKLVPRLVFIGFNGFWL